MKSLTVGAVAVSLLVGVACHGSVQINPSPKIPTSSRWTGTLATPPNLAGAVQIHGTAWMAQPSMSDSAHTLISLQITNAASGGLHPWSIRQGTCGNDQGEFGSERAYRPLHVGSDGTASATVTQNQPPPRTGSYFVQVVASPTNTGTVIACGNLAPPSA
jgi:hypothetical protein